LLTNQMDLMTPPGPSTDWMCYRVLVVFLCWISNLLCHLVSLSRAVIWCCYLLLSFGVAICCCHLVSLSVVVVWWCYLLLSLGVAICCWHLVLLSVVVI
jgi:hypothetical protein